MNLNPKDFKKFFRSEFEITCWNSEFLLRGSLGRSDLFSTYKNKVFNIFIKKNTERICLNEGVNIFSTERYDRYIAEFKDHIKKSKKIIEKHKVVRAITKEEFIRLDRFLAKFWWLYGITEFSYMDLAYKEVEGKAKENLEELSRFKFKAREVLNSYFFKNGVIDNVLAYISRKFNVNARFLYSDEILMLYEGKDIDRKMMDQREKCYSNAIINGEIVRFDLKESLRLNKLFTEIHSEIIKGITASPGKAKGRVVIAPMLNNIHDINKIDSLMEKGDILIAETTSPDILMLCNKATAIVAEQGGLLSHAAIVSRELGIPCIIQAENATRIFKNGDLVEVDADKGTVRKVTTTK